MRIISHLKPVGFLLGIAAAILMISYLKLTEEYFFIFASLSAIFAMPSLFMRRELFTEVYSRLNNETLTSILLKVKNESKRKFYTYLICEIAGGIALFFIGAMLVFMPIALRNTG